MEVNLHNIPEKTWDNLGKIRTFKNIRSHTDTVSYLAQWYCDNVLTNN